MVDPRAILAAENNADWYEMMFEVHGLRFARDSIGFRALNRPPPFHSRLTWTNPTLADEVLDRVAQDLNLDGFGIKDSFSQLELEGFGLRCIFDASWIWCDAAPSTALPHWKVIETEEDLLAWESAWKVGGSPSDLRQFPAAILNRPDVCIWGREGEQGFDAGCIANLSENCVGLSNAFGSDVFPAATQLTLDFGKGRPLVGYERGADLENAKRAGCESVGPLNVWIKPT